MTDRTAPPAPRRRTLILGVLAAVLAVLVGYVAGYVTPILRAPADTSPEAGFARDMSTHHAQAVEMAMMAWPKLTDDELRSIAYDIALGQQGEIGRMSQWLKDWGLNPAGSQPKMAWMPGGAHEVSADGLMPGMATTAQISQLDAATGKAVDILFAQLMLRHHLGGIHMIDGLLALSQHTDVTDLAKQMKVNQQAEVDIFKRKLTELGAQPLGT